MSNNEVRVTDPKTGAQKGSKDQRFDLVPWDAITLLSEHLNKGAIKYAPRNWEQGYAWSLSFAALMRHLTLWYQDGEDIDADTGSHHLQAVMFHAMALMTYVHRDVGTDDRPSTLAAKPAPALLGWEETKAMLRPPFPLREAATTPTDDGFLAKQAEQAVGLEPGTLLLSVQQ